MYDPIIVNKLVFFWLIIYAEIFSEICNKISSEAGSDKNIDGTRLGKDFNKVVTEKKIPTHKIPGQEKFYFYP